MIVIVLLLVVGAWSAIENTTETPGTLRNTLHEPPVGVAPTTTEDALTVAVSEGASHFQKLPSNLKFL